jgi:hypothetical protein
VHELFTRPEKYSIIASIGDNRECRISRIPALWSRASRVIRMGFTGLKLGVAAVGGVIFTMAGLVQSAAADPIYHLERARSTLSQVGSALS